MAALENEKAWKVMLSFAGEKGGILPETSDCLLALLGDCYQFNDWKLTFDAVLRAKNNTAVTISVI
jgi:hypothetical protein